MPRKRRKAVPAIVDQVDTIKEVCLTIDIHQNTATAWRREGAPAGPPYSVVAWYAWGKSKGYQVSLPQDSDLARLCKVATKPKSDAPPEVVKVARELVDFGRELGINPPDEYEITDEGDRTLAWQRWASAINGVMDLQERRGQLIPLEMYRQRLRALADGAIAQLQDVHAVTRDVVNLTHQQRGELRDGLNRWLTLTRQRLSASLNLTPANLAPPAPPHAAS